MPRILLVEDNPLHTRLVRSMLEEVWLDVSRLCHAGRLADALALIRECRPECVLLDLMLPDAEGLEALDAVLAEIPGIPVVVLSAHDEGPIAIQAVRKGAQDYLVKGSVGAAGLAKAISFAIERSHARKSDAIAVLDLAGRVVRAGADLAHLAGVGVADVIAAEPSALLDEGDLAAWREAVAAAGAGRVSVVTVHFGASGRTAEPVTVELSPVGDAAGEPVGLVARYLTSHLAPGAVETPV